LGQVWEATTNGPTEKQMSKVSYKIYFNNRLKQVSLYGHMTYPLYIQVTHKRIHIFFKSYYFDLFSKSRHFLPDRRADLPAATGETVKASNEIGIDKFGPSIEEITSKEIEVIDFIINRHPDDFSLDLFKREYAFYSKDLCDITEDSYINYLHTFFQSRSMPALAVTVREGARHTIAYEVIHDMKKALSRSFYDQLVESSLYFSPPYLPLYGFMQQTKKWPMLCLTIMEWQNIKTQTAFTEYMKIHYPEIDTTVVTDQLAQWLDTLRP